MDVRRIDTAAHPANNDTADTAAHPANDDIAMRKPSKRPHLKLQTDASPETR